MTKQSGLGSQLWFGSVDLSGDVGAVDAIETLRGTESVSAINQSAEDRILTIRDGNLSFVSFWNTAASQSVPTLNALPRTDVQVTVALGTPALGTAAGSILGKQTTLTPERGQDGSLRVTTAVAGNGYPLEFGELLTTGKQTFATGTVSGSSIDLGAVSTLFGAAAYLHVFSVASGTATFTVEDSANDTDFTAVTGMAFTGATGATTQRLQGAVNATVRRYVRITGSGVHGAAVVAVNFVRYTESPA